MKTKHCENCELEMNVDLNPYHFNKEGIDTAKKTNYGVWVCSDECEKEFDLRIRKDAESFVK